MRIVEFLLHKSLLDKNPTVVKSERDFSSMRSLMLSNPIPVVLKPSSDTREVLWNFSRFKDGRRLTLKDNPHFYKRLPISAEKYNGQFRADPIDTFHHDKISVLTDNPYLGRLFLETAKEKRAFGNAWVTKEAIVFKGLYLSVFFFLTS